MVSGRSLLYSETVSTLDDELRQAARDVYRRYQLEFVEAHNLCPYARQARLAGNVREVVITKSEPRAAALDEVATLAKDESVEIGLLICPRVDLDRVEWERWVSSLIGEDAERHPPGRVPFAMAAFHPEADLRTERPESLVPYIRRSPDPTIQLVRVSALERVRAGFDEGTTYVDASSVDLKTFVVPSRTSLRERICAANERTLVAASFEQVEALLQDIQAERRRRYAALGIEAR
jgi:hypothetical protein